MSLLSKILIVGTLFMGQLTWATFGIFFGVSAFCDISLMATYAISSRIIGCDIEDLD